MLSGVDMPDVISLNMGQCKLSGVDMPDVISLNMGQCTLSGVKGTNKEKLSSQ